MIGAQENRYHTLVHLLALADRLEGEGQLNVAKLVRAGVESMLRKSAYLLDWPIEKSNLATEVEKVVDALAAHDLDQDLLAALRRGTSAIQAGRLSLYGETPDVFVCRTCGHVTLAEPQGKCPTCDAWPTTYLRFPPVYWLDALDPFRALDMLRQTPLSVAALLEGLSEAELSQPPAEGGWSLRNVISHLRDAQGLLSFRLDRMLDEDNPPLESKAVFEWAAADEGRPEATPDIFADYRRSRRLARIVHAADVEADLDTDPIGRGLETIATGFSLRYPDDGENLRRQFEVYDSLYAWCRLQVARGSE